MLNALLFSLICTGLMLYFVFTFIDNWNDIEREEIERKVKAKYDKEARYWREQTLRSRTVIKVMDGETFSLENRR